jgi:hypothetical protein
MFKTTIASCAFRPPSVLCRLFSTTVESALQNHLFLTNKANFQKVKFNVTNVLKGDYAKWTLGERGKNKANSKPKQTQFKPKQGQFRKGVPAY